MEQLNKAIQEYETRLQNYKIMKEQSSKQDNNYLAICCSIVDTEDYIITLKRAKRLIEHVIKQGE